MLLLVLLLSVRLACAEVSRSRSLTRQIRNSKRQQQKSKIHKAQKAIAPRRPKKGAERMAVWGADGSALAQQEAQRSRSRSRWSTRMFCRAAPVNRQSACERWVRRRCPAAARVLFDGNNTVPVASKAGGHHRLCVLERPRRAPLVDRPPRGRGSRSLWSVRGHDCSGARASLGPARLCTPCAACLPISVAPAPRLSLNVGVLTSSACPHRKQQQHTIERIRAVLHEQHLLFARVCGALW